jgi:hypothetical protein
VLGILPFDGHRRATGRARRLQRLVPKSAGCREMDRRGGAWRWDIREQGLRELRADLVATGPGEQVDVVIEMTPPVIVAVGTRAERVAATKRGFDGLAWSMIQKISPAGGEVPDTAWINSTVRGRIPVGVLNHLLDDVNVRRVDAPGSSPEKAERLGQNTDMARESIPDPSPRRQSPHRLRPSARLSGVQFGQRGVLDRDPALGLQLRHSGADQLHAGDVGQRLRELVLDQLEPGKRPAELFRPLARRRSPAG